MGKTGRWIKNFLGGKKDKEKEKNSSSKKNIPRGAASPATTPVLTPPSTAKEKRRWSFRRSSASVQKEPISDATPTAAPPETETEHEPEKPEITAAAADGGSSVSSTSVTKLEVSAANSRRGSAIEEFAAVKIQSVFRAYLARKALNALKGLVKLQALVRGHLVRKQATATLRCMQALVTVQARARAQRIKIAKEESYLQNHLWQLEHTKSYHNLEENIKIVEMDLGEYRGNTRSRNSYSNSKPSVMERPEQHRYSTYSTPPRPQSRQDHRKDVSPASSNLTEMSPRASSNHFEDYGIGTAQSTPHYYSAMSKTDHPNFPVDECPEKGSVEYAESLNYDYTLCPSYMANTQSSRAKARSQSAPKSRPETFERQPSRRRVSLEGRNVPRSVRMQRSSSHVGATAQNYNYPWSVRLDKSYTSLKDSECGSTSTVLTSTQYCRSLAGFDVRGGKY